MTPPRAIEYHLPNGNLLTIEDRDRNDRFNRGDIVRINGEVYRPNPSICQNNDNLWQYFSNLLGIAKLDQIGSLTAAARVIQERQSAIFSVMSGHPDRAEELIRSSNAIAYEHSIPTTFSSPGPNLLNSWLFGLEIFTNSSRDINPTHFWQIYSLMRSEACDAIPSEPLSITGGPDTLSCSSCSQRGRGERQYPFEVNPPLRDGETQQRRQSNRRAVVEIFPPRNPSP